MPKQKAFPKTIYVTRENAGTDDEYLNIHTDADTTAFEETTVVAVYDLTSTRPIEVKREFQWDSRALETSPRRQK